MKCKIFLVVFLVVSAFASADGGTVIGNGGDPVYEFMEAARTSMIETLKIIANDTEEQASFCNQAPLESAQIQFCHDYFLVVLKDMLRLSQGLNKTPFKLTEEKLRVIGPDGTPVVVPARTELGPEGPIEFNRDEVKTMLPTQFLLLITHEFQHKSNFNGAFVSDNDPLGPFATGRELIDYAAKYVVALARRKAKIGSQFGIRSIFDCIAKVGSTEFIATLSGARLFQSEDMMSYESSFGKNPSDETIGFPETSDTALILRFVITEPNNCGDSNPARSTLIQIVRRTKLLDGSRQDVVISGYESPVNPMCPDSDPTFEIARQNIRFSCKYFGSEGTTSSPFSLRSSKSFKAGLVKGSPDL